jgi:hypothetical protein
MAYRPFKGFQLGHILKHVWFFIHISYGNYVAGSLQPHENSNYSTTGSSVNIVTGPWAEGPKNQSPN